MNKILQGQEYFCSCSICHENGPMEAQVCVDDGCTCCSHLLEKSGAEIPEHIPFKRYFKNRMLTGKKTATSRSKMLGKPGDRFEAFGEWFEFTEVARVSLGDVAISFHKQEGFETKEDFLDCWAEMHPRAKFDLTKPVWLHQFRLIENKGKRE